MSLTMNRKRFFAFLTLMPHAMSLGQCDSNGVCSVQGGIKNGAWWRKELMKSSEECRKIDPGSTGTCHQWTVELSKEAKAKVLDIKTSVQDYILTTEQVGLKSRLLQWNDPMDELYLSAPKNNEGSDRVFVTPHIDGFVGWIPFVRAWRCVYGLTGPHDTVTVQPMRNPDEREVLLAPGVFTCFDFNREIHWIENRPSNHSTIVDERMVFKLHFYEYPALFGDLGHWFGWVNAQYNFFARRAFLVSQFPDRSLFARLVARGINGITLFGGSFEFFGYCNAGLLLCLAAAVRFDGARLVAWAAPLHLWAVGLAAVFREHTLGVASRDAHSLLAVAALLVGAPYALAQAQHFHAPSAALAGGGAALAWAAAEALGADFLWFGAQLAPAQLGGLPPVAAGPYATLTHPWCLGCLVALLGLRLHPTFGPDFRHAFWALSAAHVALLLVEVADLHVPLGSRYLDTYADFAKYHQVPLNVYAHLLTTGLSALGALALAQSYLAQTPAAKAAKARPLKLGLLAAGLTWAAVRFSVPDDDVAFALVGLAWLGGATAAALRLSPAAGWACVAGGALLQELAHHAAGEVTYMAAYVSEAAAAGGAGAWAAAAGTFALHNVWLLPFEVRAAINAATAALVPAAA